MHVGLELPLGHGLNSYPGGGMVCVKTRGHKSMTGAQRTVSEQSVHLLDLLYAFMEGISEEKAWGFGPGYKSSQTAY